MNTPQDSASFQTVLRENLDEHHVYILEAVAGRGLDTFSRVPNIWAHIRRRIHDLSTNHDRWIHGVRCTTTSEDPTLVTHWIDEQQKKAEKRIRTIHREGVDAYVARNGAGSDFTGKVPTDTVVKSATENFSIAKLLEASDEVSPSEDLPQCEQPAPDFRHPARV